MSPDNIETLTARVQNGILFHATPEQIRRQLEAEGIDSSRIKAALERGIRAANVRLGKE